MPRSILKNTLSSFPNTTPSPARSREDRNKETALHHARLLQQRKDVEALILASTEALLELPSSPAADPARPRLQDITIVKASLKPFQPSDYDSLIEERNINRQCGYVFCPRPNRQEDTKAKYRILYGKGRGSNSLKFVEPQSLERWCSNDCGKRALYVKVQLNEEPAWNRVGSSGGDILFLEERNDQRLIVDDSTLIERLRSLESDLEEDEVVAKMKALAIERGDEKAPSRSFGLAGVDVRENRNLNGKSSAPEPCAKESDSAGSFDSIEGYTPKFSIRKSTEPESGNDEDDDMMPTI